MKKMLFLLGAGVMVAAAPVAAQPGNGHGNMGHGYSHSDHGYGHSDHGQGRYYGYGTGGCPPGLAKKNNGCLPPGKFKKMYNVGQRYNRNYGYSWNYNQIPYDLRSQYGFRPNYNYYYDNGYLYQVNPRTMLIQQVVNAIPR